MTLDIFSTFDDHNKVLINISYMVWIIPLVINYLIFNKIIIGSNSHLAVKGTRKKGGGSIRRSPIAQIGGTQPIIGTLLGYIVTFNLLGLCPYVFRATSHMAINLTLALPIWFALVLIARTYNFSSFLSHLQPIGSPAILNPFLCVVELISIVVRPFTLAVRLTANLSTGHILIGLLGSAFTRAGIASALLITIVGVFYFIFEIAVCIIQAYIFILLPSLYADDHPTDR